MKHIYDKKKKKPATTKTYTTHLNIKNTDTASSSLRIYLKTHTNKLI